MTVAFCTEYVTATGCRRRIRYTARDGDGFWRITEQYDHEYEEWRFIGRECVRNPSWTLIEVDDE
jgi:hypothetical protein